jgi:hypothetical protein
MAGRKREVSVAADASHFLSVEYAVFVKRIAYESAKRHSQISLSHTRPSASRNLPTLGVWMNSNLTTCGSVELWNRKILAVLGPSDCSSRSGQSSRKISRVTRPVGRSCDGAIVHHFRCLQHEWVLACVRVTDWLLEYGFWFKAG